jgi:hypothetical protein
VARQLFKLKINELFKECTCTQNFTMKLSSTVDNF